MKLIFHAIIIAIFMISIIYVFQCKACEDQKKKIRFVGNAWFTKSHLAPGTCKEHYHLGTYAAIPRHGDNKNGTAPGKYTREISDDDGQTWSDETIKDIKINCPQTKVTWNNNTITYGSGTIYTFNNPSTPITYYARFISGNPQHESRTLVGGETSTATSAGGNGVSVYTWIITTPQSNDPIGKRRAIRKSTTEVEVKEKVNPEPADWVLKYSLPKT